MPSSLIALGANLGDRERTLHAAIERLAALGPTTSLSRSRWHETAPIGGPPNQGPFLNAAVRLETTASPEQLHHALRTIERDLGRRRVQRWEARAIDLDLLLCADQVIETSQLVVPHPRMAFRRFVLEAAVEVAADMVHPTIGWTVGQLLDHLNSAAEYVSLFGVPGSGKTALADLLARAFHGRTLLHGLPPAPAEMADSTPPGTFDPPSQRFARQIQFLDRFTSLLERGHWSRTEGLAVSDFYLDQCLAYARIELDQDQQAAFAQAWQGAKQQVVPPKLLIVLDTPPSVLAVPAGRRSDPAEHAWPPNERLRREMLRLACRKDLGPVLFVGGMDQPAQYEEISAAITSMH
jgi:2-amino-4-hydroxy-6-hydroxymethyldihydropteridine diphosphokinase